MRDIATGIIVFVLAFGILVFAIFQLEERATAGEIDLRFDGQFSKSELDAWEGIVDEGLLLLGPLAQELRAGGVIINITTWRGACKSDYALACAYTRKRIIWIHENKFSLHPNKREKVLATLLHEFGHMLISDEAKKVFAVLHEKNPGGPTIYSELNASEDFAESFSEYILNPSRMQNLYNLRYTTLKRIIFGGREYQDYP